MVRPLAEKVGAKRILEVGAGTGPFTRKILAEMGPDDTLSICEINAFLLNQLKKSLEGNSHYLAHKDRIVFVRGSIEDLPSLYPDAEFDVIVSGLPFSNFSPNDVENILNLLCKMLAKNGCLSFFEYIGIRKFGNFAPSAKHRARIRGVESIIRKWKLEASRSGAVTTNISLLNIPPALAVHYVRSDGPNSNSPLVN